MKRTIRLGAAAISACVVAAISGSASAHWVSGPNAKHTANHAAPNRPASQVHAARASARGPQTSCTVAAGPSDDATVDNMAFLTGNPLQPGDPTPNYNAADILNVVMTADTSAQTLTVTMQMNSMHDTATGGPQLYSAGVLYWAYFGTDAKGDWLVEADLPEDKTQLPTLSEQSGTFYYGDKSGVVGGQGGFRERLGTAQGKISFANSTISITIPWSAVGLHAGDRVGSVTAETRGNFTLPLPQPVPVDGVVLPIDQGVLSTDDYLVGQGCAPPQ